MQFDPPLVLGVLLQRRQRFLCDVALETGEVVVAHCPNSGTLATVAVPGRRVAMTLHPPGDRKLAWTVELIEVGTTWVLVNTMRPNRIAEAAIVGGAIVPLTGYGTPRREVKLGANSRIDLVLPHAERGDCWIEVKCVTMAEDGIAKFPDAVTTRGRKHLHELIEVRRNGGRAVQLFVVARGDCQQMSAADAIDPDYGAALRAAHAAGVELIAIGIVATPQQIVVDRSIPVLL
jgi:sugar fermentation stimulation protein A